MGTLFYMLTVGTMLSYDHCCTSAQNGSFWSILFRNGTLASQTWRCGPKWSVRWQKVTEKWWISWNIDKIMKNTEITRFDKTRKYPTLLRLILTVFCPDTTMTTPWPPVYPPVYPPVHTQTSPRTTGTPRRALGVVQWAIQGSPGSFWF